MFSTVQDRRSRDLLRLSFWLAVALLLTLGGYLVFRTYVTNPISDRLGLYLLAVVAAVASFFSPCAFPLLPGYLALYYQEERRQNATEPSAAQRLVPGYAAALGVFAFTLGLGLLIAGLDASFAVGFSISSPEPSLSIRYFRGALGLALLVLGVGQIRGWNLKPGWLEAFIYRSRRAKDGKNSLASGLFVYGFGYVAAGLGCTGPILAGLILYALSVGNSASALIAFAIFASTMTLLMVLVSWLAAASKQSLLTRLKATTPKIKRTSSYVLMVVGLFNLYTAIDLEFFLRTFFP